MQPSDLSFAPSPDLSTTQPAAASRFPAPVPTPPAPPPLWSPERLGPLGKEPATVTEPPQLFAGETRFLSRRQIKRRLELQEAIWPAMSRLLVEGEQILYIAPAVQVPPFFHQLGLGAWWPYFHQVALVLTDRRVIEVELKRRGTGLGTRLRSWRWDQSAQVKMRFSRLWLRGGGRRRFSWGIRLRADRRLLKLLLAKLDEHLSDQSEPLRPSWHCPTCGHASSQSPNSCEVCATCFRTRGMAAALAFAFPGAGLLYAGHPILAALDFFGEVLLFAVVALVALQVGDGLDLAAVAAGAAFLLALTKLESAHIATVLVDRAKPVSPPSAQRWKGFAAVGAGLSALAIAAPLFFAGSISPAIDHDLELAADNGWQGSRTRAEWLVGQEAAEKRSEWYGPQGELVAVMAYPLSTIETFDGFTLGFGSQLSAPVETVELGAFEAAHAVEHVTGASGETFARIIYALYDPLGHDVHVVTLDSEADGVESALAGLSELVRRGSWVAAAPAGGG